MFVVLRSFDNYIPANLMLQRLEAEHIRAYLQDEHTPILTNPVGSIRLMVHEAQVGRALDLLDRFDQTYRQSLTCPKCSSTNVHYVTQGEPPKSLLTLIFSWISGKQPISLHQVYHCFDCRFEFEDLPNKQEEQLLP
ncbi:DUF2007 domain-containing protein [Paraflavitalea sp. CAU 1676]|uniref:putative signal transducing protein n=1 Tax=Paraflavitalea sp. CAU 1676 TaxID=3032598 RepID=UPI0023DC4021|nr:DUF2007 domain-containing protein [Paraflavitalea sp. CAU 1676]MDF2191013.1 DUF2007 domain-containing protein [Paraflavitalea sp. CAU 1676]